MQTASKHPRLLVFIGRLKILVCFLFLVELRFFSDRRQSLLAGKLEACRPQSRVFFVPIVCWELTSSACQRRMLSLCAHLFVLPFLKPRCLDRYLPIASLRTHRSKCFDRPTLISSSSLVGGWYSIWSKIALSLWLQCSLTNKMIFYL